MTDDKRKNMQKMEEDDLSGVSGGLSVFNKQGPNTGKYTPGNRMVLSGTVDGDETASADSIEGGGIGTVMTNCPRCNRVTKHLVFNGGRGKCTVCGFTRDKL